MQLTTLFLENYKKNKWTNTPKPLLLAVSGGRDSMAMAHLFLSCKIDFVVAHCNFQLRGDDALADEALVKNWCSENNIPFYVQRFDTKKESELLKAGIQETARKLRYDWFQQLATQHNFQFIATAHHANDTVETLLINLFKGTGINGLQGIPQQNGNIIRPLLFANREDINTYITENHIPYRDDLSNKEDKYLRNAVRLHIVPTIEKYFPNANKQLLESIHRFQQADALYNQAVTQKTKKLIEKRGNDFYIPVLKLQKVQPLEALCYELFKPFGFTGNQTPQLINLISASSGKQLFSATHRVIKDRNFLIITSLKTTEATFLSIENLPKTIETEGKIFQFSTITNTSDFTKTPDEACLDLTKITLPLTLRKWRQGDYFYPLGMGMKKKKLSRFFIDQKIPLHDKENIWVITAAQKILWVCGYRIDERFKLTEKSTAVLKIKMRMQ
jgi:tRNA(Ile)-lysidine synthase